MKKTGIELIAEERREQIEKHGRTIESDAIKNKKFELSNAAAVLATEQGIFTSRKRLTMMPDDWDDNVCIKMCRKSHKERLIIAGALIAAELDRIQWNEGELSVSEAKEWDSMNRKPSE